MPEPDHIFFCLGEGGHTRQVLLLSEDAHFAEYSPVFVVKEGDSLSAKKARSRSEHVHSVPNAFRVPGETFLHQAVRIPFRPSFYRSFLICWSLLARYRPCAIVSSGPADFLPLFLFAKIFGVKRFYCESWSRITVPSLSARLHRPFCDVLYVQWEPMLKKIPGSIYRGRMQ